MEKDYTFNVTIKFSNTISAESKEEAIAILREMFKQDHNIDLDYNEIEFVE